MACNIGTACNIAIITSFPEIEKLVSNLGVWELNEELEVFPAITTRVVMVTTGVFPAITIKKR